MHINIYFLLAISSTFPFMQLLTFESQTLQRLKPVSAIQKDIFRWLTPLVIKLDDSHLQS